MDTIRARIFLRLAVLIGCSIFGACAGENESPPVQAAAKEASKSSLSVLPTGQAAYTFEADPPVEYLLYRPAHYWEDPKRKWPLIIYLHGTADRGEDPELVRRDGMARLVEDMGHFPFIVLSPQIPTTLNTDNLIAVFESYQQLLAQIVATHTVDPDRIYLTGLSLGGYLTWVWASLVPNQFAAIAPICAGGARGGGLTSERLCLLKELPIWTFHGEQDQVVPAVATREKVEALRACGGQVKFTLYPGVGHNAWTRTYHNPELFAWLMLS